MAPHEFDVAHQRLIAVYAGLNQGMRAGPIGAGSELQQSGLIEVGGWFRISARQLWHIHSLLQFHPDGKEASAGEGQA